MSKKQIVLNQEVDEKLGVLCSAALKNAGIEVIDHVNALIGAIKEEPAVDPSAHES